VKCTKHTHYYLQGITNQYISVNNILGIKLCLAVKPTSKWSVRLWALWRSLWLWRGGGCSERAFYL